MSLTTKMTELRITNEEGDYLLVSCDRDDSEVAELCIDGDSTFWFSKSDKDAIINAINAICGDGE
jgi:hypothetical protein